MAAEDGLKGRTDAMHDFNLTGPDPGAVNQPVPGQCGGGLVECGSLRAVEQTAVEHLVRFVTDVVTGFQAYTAIADACAARYESADAQGAAVLAQAANQGPRDIADSWRGRWG
ncbi:hypothetical protein ALI22I_01460 [Saccharothrix sp. ALI-22-I]|uniref:hypothetical protein n=1 Tax=Saccharothrix sp. ALI-22-I TaxID=1933778 RepID=UPI00097C2B45|nr:hypothetical protein [Saccharothrix sp. ALI-22-I]ONI92872.1 hypothetical protein ALI22I_01460 [Saccharothrix sp. ALI-22-I]